MSEPIRNLTDLFSLIVKNPTLAKHLKSDPRRVAEMFGVTLSEDEAAKISEKLDLNCILSLAKEVDSMAAKVAQGVGIQPSRGSRT
jgi:hypothetical protein